MFLTELGLQATLTAIITLTITRSKLFRPLRGYFTGWRKELLSCPYCFSHWASLLVTLGYYRGGWGGFLLVWGFTTAAAAPLMWVIYHSIAGIGGGDDGDTNPDSGKEEESSEE